MRPWSKSIGLDSHFAQASRQSVGPLTLVLGPLTLVLGPLTLVLGPLTLVLGPLTLVLGQLAPGRQQLSLPITPAQPG